MTRTLLAAIARFLSGASVRWIDCQPDTCQRVYFANHTSHLDADRHLVVAAAAVRALTRPVAAKDYWEKGVVRRYLATEVFNALLIDRKEIKVHQSPVDLMLKAMGDTPLGDHLSRREGATRAPRLASSRAAYTTWPRSGPIWSWCRCIIDNMNRVLPRGEFLPVPLLSCITFGPPMWLESRRTQDRVPPPRRATPFVASRKHEL